ncbi:MAG: RNA polymerase sigma factor [Bacteroidales bacterium]|nr:RNA polymerase sigma factor [Bacteroidales bacterium]
MNTTEFKNRFLPLKNKIFRLSLRMLQNREEAEDVIQEAFLKLWKMNDQLEKYQNPEGLLMTMTRNLCIDKIKSKKNKAVSLVDEWYKGAGYNPHHQSELRDLLGRVMQVMDMLPEHQRTIIQLRDVEQYSFDEIAEITGHDNNYLRVNLSRARKKIKETIEKLQKNELQTNRQTS